jgi:hypothetical protein
MAIVNYFAVLKVTYYGHRHQVEQGKRPDTYIERPGAL